MILKEDILNILVEVYKSDFDDDSMDLLSALTSLITCACDVSNDITDDGKVRDCVLDAIAKAWMIYTIQTKSESGEYVERVQGFLQAASKLRQKGWNHFSQAEHAIKEHLNDRWK